MITPVISRRFRASAAITLGLSSMRKPHDGPRSMSEEIDLDEFDPPDRPDFRRIGRGIPYVVNPESDKRERYSRSSKAGNILDDESNLTDWKLRTVVVGAAVRPELMARASVLDPDLHKKDLREIAELCLVAGRGERRAVTGSAIHAMFDHIDRGTKWIPPPQFEELCLAYQRMLSDWGLIPMDIEVQCVNDEFRLAGTLDRRYRTVSTLVAPDGSIIPIGSMIVADIKTGAELEYASGSYACQLTAYVDSMRYNVQTDERHEWEPESVKDWALIIHADSMGTRVDVYWCDLNAGRIGLRLADEVKQWRRRSDLLVIGNRLRIVSPKPVTETNPEASPASAPDGRREPATEPVEPRRTALRHEYLAGRIRALRAQSEVAAKALQMQWPEGIPGLKHEGHTWEQLDAIEVSVMDIEKRYSIGFYPPFDDPAIEEAKREHPSSQAYSFEIPKRSALIRQWLSDAIQAGGINARVDQSELANSLREWGNIDETEWPDDDLTTMLDGSMRAIGYENGVLDLGRFDPDHAPLLMSAAFAIVAGNAYLLWDENEKPIVRTNVRKP
jgi:hypothetical protein